ncbi:50S ribosomal protein L9 [Candidatus Parcubacteria bacterium]|nr:50S ribosomal protein L9 [Candidatus Parcubacteria bacterium]
MKVILTKDVQNLGCAGDIKEIADGYARNFLIPGGYVAIATKDIIKQSEKMKLEKEKQAEEGLKIAEELSGKLESMSVTIKSKADDSGKLYAAIKAKEISELLGDKGFDINKDKIVIGEPIKEIGDYEVVINLDHGLEVRIGVVVESEK